MERKDAIRAVLMQEAVIKSPNQETGLGNYVLNDTKLILNHKGITHA